MIKRQTSYQTTSRWQNHTRYRPCCLIYHLAILERSLKEWMVELNDFDLNLSNKSKATQAMVLFKNGRKPIEVSIELDISAREIEDILQEYWVLNQLDELALVYYEIKNDLDLFLKLFHTLKKNKSINRRDIERLLGYAVYDLPSVEMTSCM